MYRFEARIVGRSQGKSATKAAAHNTGKRNSAVKAAAYLSRSELTDAKGQTWDYSNHFGGAGSLLLLPHGTPKQFEDREFLWRSVEKIENRKDSMLARDPIITMPWQLTQKEMWAAIRSFADREFVSHGKPVDLGLHIYGEPWKAWAEATKAKVEEWKEKKYPFHEQGHVPDDCTGPHVLVVRGKRDQIKEYYLYQPHMHLMTTFRSLDPESPTGWAKYKDTVTDGNWFTHEKPYIEHLKKAWAEIGADALLAKGLTIEADRFRVGYLTNAEQRKAAIGRGDLEWADQLNRTAEPKKGPIAAKMEREDRGLESKAVLEWLKVKTGNEIIYIDRQIDQLDVQKRKKAVSESADPSSREYASRQQREINERTKEQQDKLSPEQLEIGRRFYEQIDIQTQERARIEREKLDARTPEEPDITDAKGRFLKAAGERFDIRRPEASLSEVVGLEGARAKEEHEKLTSLAAREKDEDKKRDILFRRDIMHADYMAITSERLVSIYGYTEGRSRKLELDENGKPIPHQTEAERQQAKAEFWKEEGDRLRTERQDLHDRMGQMWIDRAINQKDVAELQRSVGLDPNHTDPGRYRPLDHHLERTKGLTVGSNLPRPDPNNPALRVSMDEDEKGIRVGDIIGDRRAMQQAMQTERQITDPHHEVTGRVRSGEDSRTEAREMTDKEIARQTARENYQRAQNVESRERDQVGGHTHAQGKSRGGRSL